MIVEKGIGLITLIMVITAIAIVLSKRTNTVPFLNALFKGINNLQRTAVSPIK